ncbi:MAG: hypothetical protein Q9M48_04645 [Rhodobacterales bacterium]|nr:hypothetical protein [Rhodobacterales bacterium]
MAAPNIASVNASVEKSVVGLRQIAALAHPVKKTGKRTTTNLERATLPKDLPMNTNAFAPFFAAYVKNYKAMKSMFGIVFLCNQPSWLLPFVTKASLTTGPQSWFWSICMALLFRLLCVLHE